MPRRRRRNAEATAAEMYAIAGDAVEQGDHKGINAARKIVAEAREKFPGAHVPGRVQELVDFDLDEVERDFTNAFANAEELEIEEDDVWGQPAFKVLVDGTEYYVVRNEESAVAAAIAYVTEDLKNEPEVFNRDFLERHIDEERLKKYVYDIRMEDDYVDELASRQPRDFWRLAEQFDIEVEPDEDGEMPDPDDYVDQVKEAYAQNAADSPMEFFEEMYGRREAVTEAIKAAGIDIDAAAQDAVDTDGWPHFLSHYDGRSDETNAGFVYWRE